MSESLEKLNKLGLVFKPKRSQPTVEIYSIIEQDLCHDLSYFPDEFRSLVKRADKQTQLDALKELVIYCTAFLIDRETRIDMHQCSKITLCGGNNEWELRLYLNAHLEKLEEITFNLWVSKETGAAELAPIKEAHPLSLSCSTDEMEIFLELVKQLNAQHALVTDKKCPEQLRKGNKEELDQFEAFCAALNGRIAIWRNSSTNFFAYSDLLPTELFFQLLSKYLPTLRFITLQTDQGESFLVTDNQQICPLLIECLKLITQRENELLGTTVKKEEQNMSDTNVTHVTTNNFHAPVENATVGNNNHVEINTVLNELIPILRELKKGLALKHSAESDEIKALDEAINQKPESPDMIKIMGNTLGKVKKIVNQGTALGKLYDKAESLYQTIGGVLF